MTHIAHPAANVALGFIPDDPSVLDLPVQRSAAGALDADIVQFDAAGESALPTDQIHAIAAQGVSSTSSPLPHLEVIQHSFGKHDITGVRAHVRGAAAEASVAMGARAYATGDQVAFAATPDLHLAAHEAAHVVQQRGGVQLSDGVGRAGDPYEQHADAVADRVVRGESAEALLDASPSNGGDGGGVQMSNETATTSVSAHMIGHASPRWEHPRGETSEERNLRLSQDRVDMVRTYFQELMNRALSARGVDGDVQVTCRAVDDDRSSRAPEPTSEARGSRDTTREADGDTHSDDRSMRRVDILVTVTWLVRGEAEASVGDDVLVTEPCATRLWSIRLGITGGATPLPIPGVPRPAGWGFSGAAGELKNGLTNQIARGWFIGVAAGGGLSLPTPAITPDDWSSWSDFETVDPVTFEAFDGCSAVFGSVEVGIGVGGSLAFIIFPTLSTHIINVSGWNVGAFGIDAGVSAGIWNLHSIPEAICAHTESRPDTEHVPYSYDMPNVMTHTVYFDTGSPVVSDVELAQLQAFIDNIMANYDWPGNDSLRSRVAPASP